MVTDPTSVIYTGASSDDGRGSLDKNFTKSEARFSLAEHVWAKVYLELPTDPKLVGRSAHDRYLWVCLILLAKANADQGVLPEWQTEPAYLSKYTAISKPEVTRALIYFRAVGMVDYDERGQMVLSHFPERQASKDPTAAERMRKLRERSGDVTSPSPKEAEAESLGARSAPNVPKVPFDPGKATEYATDQGYDEFAITKMQRKFLDHHAAGGWKRTGGVVIRDRMAAWRTWVSNELDRNPPSSRADYRPTKAVY